MSAANGRKPRLLFVWTALLLLGLAYYNGELGGIEPPKSSAQENTSNINLSTRAEKHILYGDRSGGGHKHGVGKPCKSEFPKNWDDQTILSSVKKIAANDNLSWEQQNNGYHVVEQFHDGIKVRVVMGENRRNIITAYPVNVPRNPCPANDN